MLYKNLPALNAKKEPNTVEITNRKIDPTSETGKKFVIPAEKFVYPQVETDEERIQICGGAENALAVFNDFLRDEAMKVAKDKIRIATSGSDDDIIAAGIEAGKSVTFIEQARITASEAKEKFSELRTLALDGSLSDAELAAKIRAMV